MALIRKNSKALAAHDFLLCYGDLQAGFKRRKLKVPETRIKPFHHIF